METSLLCTLHLLLGASLALTQTFEGELRSWGKLFYRENTWKACPVRPSQLGCPNPTPLSPAPPSPLPPLALVSRGRRVKPDIISLLPQGSHSLRYFDIAVSRPGLEETLYMTAGYVENTEFVHFNSATVNPRFEPRVPWMEQVGQEYWDDQTHIAKSAKQQIRACFQKLQGYYNQSQNSKWH